MRVAEGIGPVKPGNLDIRIECGQAKVLNPTDYTNLKDEETIMNIEPLLLMKRFFFCNKDQNKIN